MNIPRSLQVPIVSISAWILLCFIQISVVQADLSLNQLQTSMIDPLAKSFATAFAFRPVEPASALGSFIGVQAGFSASIADLSSINNITGGNAVYLPSADLQLGISVPLGLTIEAGILPAVNLGTASISKYAGALKWTATKSFLNMLPLDLAVRASYTSASISFSQSLQGGTVNVGYNTSLIGGQVLISKNLLIFEPFVGVGLMSQNSTLSGSGTANLFGSSFPINTQSVSSASLEPWFQGGLLIKLFILGIAAEYDYLFGNPTYTGKLSFRF